LRRSGLPVVWTGGFNPLPKIDFASPLSVGISGAHEIALADFTILQTCKDFLSRMTGMLPEGLTVTGAYAFTVPSGAKKYATPALFWGSDYESANGAIDFISRTDDKQYRLERFPDGNCFGLKRTSVLAKDPARPDSTGYAYYFEIYQRLYGRE
jgi:hypothetical protein